MLGQSTLLFECVSAETSFLASCGRRSLSISYLAVSYLVGQFFFPYFLHRISYFSRGFEAQIFLTKYVLLWTSIS